MAEREGLMTFSQEIPEEETGQDESERGKKNVITVSNATDMTVFVELHPIEMVRKGNTPALDLGLGMNAGTTNFAGTTIEAKSVSLEKEVLETKKSTVHPHSSWNIPLPDSNFSILHQQKAVLLHNSLFTRVYIETKAGDKDEIGNGYSVGPGHGIIVSEVGGRHRVDEAASRRWYRTFNPWLTKDKANIDPHCDMRRRQRCQVCGKVASGRN